MKKMILLLILPLTALMAIDFTMTKEGLFVESTATIQPSTPGTEPETSNPYLETVNLPTCDANNPEVQFIKSTADWNKINYSSKRIFCVSPGDYTSLGNIKLTASGTAEKRRYIILNNGNDTHPGKLDKSQLANFALNFNGASYWTLDRPASFDKNGVTNAYEFVKASRHNIINRMFTNNIARSVRIIDDSHNNTVQNSRLDTMTDNSRRADMTAIEIIPYPVDGVYALTGTKIINNEIINPNDGFQMVSFWSETGTALNGEGTIIDSNDIYFTSDIYTDGSGNYTPSGNYMYAENTLDFKFGSLNASNPVIISNNHLWGARKSDRTNSSIGTAGSNITVHFGAFNLHFINNVIFDSYTGIGTGGNAGFSYAWNGELRGNIFQDCGSNEENSLSFSIGNTKNTIVEDNIISKCRGGHLRAYYNYENVTVRNNISLDTLDDWVVNNNSSSGSTYAYHPLNNNNGTYKAVTAVAAGYTDDYVFTTGKFTNNPRVIVLENVMKPN